MKIKAYPFNNNRFSNWHTEVLDKWQYSDFLNHKHWKKGWISFDCCRYMKDSKTLYLGLTSFNADIFYAFDTKKKKFFSTGYEKIKDKYDAKFHRSLEFFEKDRCLYAAVAQLHDIDRYHDAPGGAIIKYNPANSHIEKVDIPFPHTYIQSICLNQEKGIIYGITLIPEKLFSYEISSGRVLDLGLIGSCNDIAQGENIEIDSHGCVWCGWNILRPWQSSPGPDSHRLCKYNPEIKKISYFNEGLENPCGDGFVKVEGIFNLDGNMFASGGNGSIYLIDIKTGYGHHICTPVKNRKSRLASLRMAEDGFAYGVIGKQGNCELLRFNPVKKTFSLLGNLSTGTERCWQIHDIAITPEMTVYACENDNPYRSGYLWEISL